MSALTVDQQAELLALTKSVDSVELKLSIADDEQYSTGTALGLDPIKAEIRQVFFFDTAGLDLDAAGIVVRARRIQGEEADTVVKLRPVDPETLPDDLRKSESSKVEVDIMPGKYVCSASLKGKSDPDEVLRAIAGKQDIAELFSKEQRGFFESHAPKGTSLNELTALGPILTLKQKFMVKALKRELVAELWFYPDHTRILELSTKCDPNETFQAVAEVNSYLSEKGVELDAEQKTKTKTALNYFAKHRL